MWLKYKRLSSLACIIWHLLLDYLPLTTRARARELTPNFCPLASVAPALALASGDLELRLRRNNGHSRRFIGARVVPAADLCPPTTYIVSYRPRRGEYFLLLIKAARERIMSLWAEVGAGICLESAAAVAAATLCVGRRLARVEF